MHLPKKKPRSPSHDDTTYPQLRFTPYAWAKLQFFCHAGPTEIGGFGLATPDDPLFVTDFLTLRQQATSVSVEFEDDAIAELFEDQVDQGRRPEQFARIWCHTHPGDSPHPSHTDEQTFTRVFEASDWAVMFILARGGQTYARLRFNTGPGGEIDLPVVVDFETQFPGTDHAGWLAVYRDHVRAAEPSWGDLTGELEHDRLIEAQDLASDDLSICAAASYGWEDDLPGPGDSFDDELAQLEHLMEAYNCSSVAELRALMLHEALPDHTPLF